MQAIVSPSSRYGTVQAFSGYEYVKFEWRDVPEGREEEASKHPTLQVRESPAVAVGAKEEVVVVKETIIEDVPSPAVSFEAPAEIPVLEETVEDDTPLESFQRKSSNVKKQGR